MAAWRWHCDAEELDGRYATLTSRTTQTIGVVIFTACGRSHVEKGVFGMGEGVLSMVCDLTTSSRDRSDYFVAIYSGVNRYPCDASC